MNVSKQVAEQVTSEIEIAVKEILSKHGMSSPKIRTTYGEIYKVSFESVIETLDENGVNITSPEVSAYERFHANYGLPAGLIGTHFIVNKKEYVFAGIATSRSKYPIVTIGEDGSKTLFTADVVAKIIQASQVKIYSK